MKTMYIIAALLLFIALLLTLTSLIFDKSAFMKYALIAYTFGVLVILIIGAIIMIEILNP